MHVLAAPPSMTKGSMRKRVLCICFLLSALRCHGDVIVPTEWDYIGPFPIGKPEFDGDPLEAYGDRNGNGILAVGRPSQSLRPGSPVVAASPKSLSTKYAGGRDHDGKHSTFFSELSPTGRVQWTRLESRGGFVQLQPVGIDFHALARETSGREIMEHQGWAVADVHVPSPGRYAMTCTHLNTLYVAKTIDNDQGISGLAGLNTSSGEAVYLVPLVGDQYGSGRVVALLDLTDRDQEINAPVTLYARVRAKVQTSFGCRIEGPLANNNGDSDDAEEERGLDKSGTAKKRRRRQSSSLSSSVSALKVFPPPWLPDLLGWWPFSPSQGVSVAGEGVFALPIFNGGASAMLVSFSAQVRHSTTSSLVHPSSETGAKRRDHVTLNIVPMVNACEYGDSGGGSAHNVARIAPGQSVMLPLKLLVETQTVASEKRGTGKDGDGNEKAKTGKEEKKLKRMATFPPCTPLVFDLTVSQLDPSSSSSTQTIRGEPLTVPRLKLRCRDPSQSFIFSFMDHDGSASHAAAVAPPDATEAAFPGSFPHLAKQQHRRRRQGGGRKKEEEREEEEEEEEEPRPLVPVLLTQHGTSITPSNQADSYKRMDRVPGATEYSFGVDGYWLVAPTRHGAHNWEHTGMLTALKAVEALARCTRRPSTPGARSSPLLPSADDRRILFAGHSMGGHGAWVAATLNPGRAIGVNSAAGWIHKEDYGDSNTVFRQDVAVSEIEPALRGLLLSTVAEHAPDRHTANLAGHSRLFQVLARTGAADMSVPPYYQRRMVRLLKEHASPYSPQDDTVQWEPRGDVGVDISHEGAAEATEEATTVIRAARRSKTNVTLDELPGKEHWWWDTDYPNDGGVTNDRTMRRMFDDARANSQTLEAAEAPTVWNDLAGVPEVSATEVALLPEAPGATFRLVCHNPATFSGRAGIRPLQLEVTGARSTIQFLPISRYDTPISQAEQSSSPLPLSSSKASRGDGYPRVQQQCWMLKTSNVNRVRIAASSPVVAPHCVHYSASDNGSTSSVSSSSAMIWVDGNLVDLSAWLGPNDMAAVSSMKLRKHGCAHICKKGEQNASKATRWELCFWSNKSAASGEENSFQRVDRGPSTYGPARQISAVPFALVYGTNFSVTSAKAKRKASTMSKLNNERVTTEEVGRRSSPGAKFLSDFAVYVANLHAMAADTFAPVFSDEDALQAMATKRVAGGGSPPSAAHFSLESLMRKRNVIAIGSPFQNSFLATKLGDAQRKVRLDREGTTVKARSAVTWIPRSQLRSNASTAIMSSTIDAAFRIEGSPCGVFDEPGTGILYLAPWWDHDSEPEAAIANDHRDTGVPRMILVAAGTDMAGTELAVRLATPTIPPMTRAPFTNLLPDWIVLGPEARLLGYGGVRAAGFWGHQWQFESRASYVKCHR